MNLLCPNCQKPLQVPEQYAGQLMKCPLCNGTFSVPVMPPPVPPAPSPVPDIYRVAPEPPPPPPLPEQTALAPERAGLETAKAPAPPTGYERTFSLVLRPHVLPWVAPVALGLVFVLLFFPWVATYDLTEKMWYDQVGWGTGFGHEGSGWGIGYVLLVVPALLVAGAAAVLPLLPVKLPPPVDVVLQWRTAIVAAVVLLLTLLLLVQLAFGFGLERMVQTVGAGPKDREPPADFEGRLKQSEDARLVARATLRRTFWLDLVVLLHLAALAGIGLDAWLQRRGPDRPPPRLEVMW